MKKVKIFILILITMFICNKVEAYSYSVPYVSTGDESSSSTPKEYEDGKRENFKTTTEYTYSCSYQYKVTTSRKVTINIYDSEGNFLNETSLLPRDNITFDAGTAIGLDIYEESKISWEIKNIQVTRSGYDCKYKIQHKNINYYSHNSCGGEVYSISNWLTDNDKHVKYVADKSNCTISNSNNNGQISTLCGTANWSPIGHKYTRRTRYQYYAVPITNESTTNYVEDCKKIAYEEVQKEVESRKYSSYKVEYYESNDIEKTKVGATAATVEGKKEECENITVDRLTANNLDFCKFNYNLGKTCINRITGNVTYKKNSNEECDLTTEIEVKTQGGAKTMYFSPLNTKSNDEFKLLLDTYQSGRKQNKRQCDYIKNNYSDWENLIVGPNNEVLNIYNYNSIASTGCYIKTSIVFPIEQKFYGEKTKSGYASLKGYGMYFRQIDIDNPFPNGLNNSPYWTSELYNLVSNKVKNHGTEVKLSTSFNSPTYIANLSSAKNITNVRNYNENISYTNWIDTMNANGTSKFIRSGATSNIFTTKAATSSFYKLGCGPSNATWKGCSGS